MTFSRRLQVLLKGASVSAGKDMTVVAGGNLMATSVTDSAKVDDVYHSKKRSQESHDYDEQAVGTSFSAGGNATLAAVSTDKSKGNVTLSLVSTVPYEMPMPAVPKPVVFFS